MIQPRVLPYEIGADIYIDTETDGLYGPVRLVQIYCPTQYDKVHLYDTRITSVDSILNAVKDCNWIGHNLAYDFSVLNYVPDFWEDTYLMSKIQFFDLDSLSLDSILEHVLGYNPYQCDKKAMQKSKWTGDLTDEQLLYAATDVYFLPDVVKVMCEVKGEMNYQLDKLTIKHFVEMKSGLPVSIPALLKQKEENLQKIDSIGCPINVNSPKQVKEYLQNFDSNGDTELARLIALGTEEQKARSLIVREVRSLLKQNSFITKYVLLAQANDGYLLGHLNLVPRSGRSNASDENIQQIPSKLKHCFESEKFLVYADFAQLELRMLCAVIGENTLYRLFSDGEDMHAYAAKQLFGEDYTKDQRQIAKIYNFASAYGASAKTIRDVVLKWSGIFVSDTEAAKNRNKWLEAYPDIKVWHKVNLKRWEKGVTGRTTLGRPYKAKLYTDMNNIMISGSAAEVAKLALHYMSKSIDIKKMLVFIHDSYTYEADTMEEAQTVAEIFAKSMQEAWKEVTKHCVFKDVPMPVTVSVHHNWKKADGDPLWTNTWE